MATSRWQICELEDARLQNLSAEAQVLYLRVIRRRMCWQTGRVVATFADMKQALAFRPPHGSKLPARLPEDISTHYIRARLAELERAGLIAPAAEKANRFAAPEFECLAAEKLKEGGARASARPDGATTRLCDEGAASGTEPEPQGGGARPDGATTPLCDEGGARLNRSSTTGDKSYYTTPARAHAREDFSPTTESAAPEPNIADAPPDYRPRNSQEWRDWFYSQGFVESQVVSAENIKGLKRWAQRGATLGDAALTLEIARRRLRDRPLASIGYLMPIMADVLADYQAPSPSHGSTSRGGNHAAGRNRRPTGAELIEQFCSAGLQRRMAAAAGNAPYGT